MRVPLGECFDFALRGDVGGFGVGSKGLDDSADGDLESQRHDFDPGGYRHLYVDYETGSGQDFYAYKVHHGLV